MPGSVDGDTCGPPAVGGLDGRPGCRLEVARLCRCRHEPVPARVVLGEVEAGVMPGRLGQRSPAPWRCCCCVRVTSRASSATATGRWVPAWRSRTWTRPAGQLVTHDDREVGALLRGALELPSQLALPQLRAGRHARRAQARRDLEAGDRVGRIRAHHDHRDMCGLGGRTPAAVSALATRSSPRPKPMPGVGLPPSSSTSPSYRPPPPSASCWPSRPVGWNSNVVRV